MAIAISILNEKPENCNLEQALQLYDQGYNVIPLEPGTKRARKGLSWKRYQSERPSRETVEKWFSEPANIGIVTGKVSNLIVLDLDSQSAIKWAKSHEFSGVTPSVITHRGYHLYFQYPDPEDLELDSASYEPYEKAEVFGNGHYVVAPPSLHPSRFQYQWDVSPSQTSPEPAPSWLLDELRSHTKTSEPKASNQANNRSERKLTVNVEELEAPNVTEGKKREILEDRILEGPAKNGSNNGRYVSYLITHLNLGSSQTEAVADTLERYPELGRKETEDAARTVYKQEYGLKPGVMAGFEGISYPDALSFMHKVAEASEWRTHTSKEIQMSPLEVEQRIFAGALKLNGQTMTTKQLAEAIGVNYGTLRNRINQGRLPKLVSVETINGVGIKIANALPKLILFTSLLTTNTYHNSLSSIDVSSYAGKGVKGYEGERTPKPTLTQDKRAPP